jgi:hypothetical protein
MRTHFRLPFFLSCCACIVAGSQAATLYWEDFDTPTADSFGSTQQWTGYRRLGTTVDTAPPNGTFSTPHGASITAGTGGPSGSPSNRYLYAQHGNGAVSADYLLTSNGITAFAPDPGNYQSLYVSWLHNHTSAVLAAAPEALQRRFAIQVDGSWYVTSENAFSTATNNGTSTFDLLTATWHRIEITTGVNGNLSVNPDILYTFDDLFSTPAQTISNVGFLIQNMPSYSVPDVADATRTIRFDNIAVTSGLLWGGRDTLGGTGTWQGDASFPTQWLRNASTPTSWSTDQIAIFGHEYDLDGPGIVTLTDGVTVRALEFYENAVGYTFHGSSINSASPTVLNINTTTPFRSLYLHPDANLTIGGNEDTYLRVKKSAHMQIYGGASSPSTSTAGCAPRPAAT